MNPDNGIVLGTGTLHVAPVGTTLDDEAAWQQLGTTAAGPFVSFAEKANEAAEGLASFGEQVREFGAALRGFAMTFRIRPTRRLARVILTGHPRERKRDRKARLRRDKQIDKSVRRLRRALQQKGIIR